MYWERNAPAPAVGGGGGQTVTPWRVACAWQPLSMDDPITAQILNSLRLLKRRQLPDVTSEQLCDVLVGRLVLPPDVAWLRQVDNFGSGLFQRIGQIRKIAGGYVIRLDVGGTDRGVEQGGRGGSRRKGERIEHGLRQRIGPGNRLSSAGRKHADRRRDRDPEESPERNRWDSVPHETHVATPHVRRGRRLPARV